MPCPLPQVRQVGAADVDVADLATGAHALAVEVHLYGKGVRPGRKIGHVNVSGTDLTDLRERARHAADYIQGVIVE